MKKIISLLFLTGMIHSCQEGQPSKKEQENMEINIDNPTNEIGLIEDLNFIPLNPERGDKAPQAGAI